MKYYLFEDYASGEKYLFETYKKAIEFALEYTLRFDFPSTPGKDYDITEMKVMTPEEAIKDYFCE